MPEMKKKTKLLGQAMRSLYFCLLPLSSSRTKYIRRHHVFAQCGSELLWQPRKLPADAKCIKIHDNVKVSAEVVFINHDVIYDLLNHTNDGFHYKEHLECIEVMDNVMIGLGAKIMPGVRIGPNAVIGAGSVVTKDVPPGTVVAGCPARVIGSFEEIRQRQRSMSKMITREDRFDPLRIAQAWDEFDRKHSGGSE